MLASHLLHVALREVDSLRQLKVSIGGCRWCGDSLTPRYLETGAHRPPLTIRQSHPLHEKRRSIFLDLPKLRSSRVHPSEENVGRDEKDRASDDGEGKRWERNIWGEARRLHYLFVAHGMCVHLARQYSANFRFTYLRTLLVASIVYSSIVGP